MAFEWDEDKARRNQKKHSISFDEAKTVFEDPYFIDFYDPDHSEYEEKTSSLVAQTDIGC